MSRSLDSKQVSDAVRALYALVQSKNKSQEGKSQMFEDEMDIFLTISLNKIPQKGRTKPIQIPLKHTLYGRDGMDVCLFCKDPKTEYKQMLEANPVENVSEVISISELKKDYRQYEDRRRLLAMYDLFVTDERILPLLPAALGTKFFLKKKQPAPVCLTRKNFAQELEKARDSTYLFLSQGPCSAVRIGKTSMTRKQVAENVLGSIQNIVAKIPRKWKNVQGVFLKTHDSVALPMYTALPQGRTRDETAEETKKVALAAKAKKVAKERAQAKVEQKERKKVARKQAKEERAKANEGKPKRSKKRGLLSEERTASKKATPKKKAKTGTKKQTKKKKK